MTDHALITADELRKLIHYEPSTGVFTRRVAVGHRGCHRAGGVAGSINKDGYRMINVCGRRYRAHHLAFLYMTGELPRAGVDHITGIRDDNRWRNLRKVTPSQSCANTRIRADNAAGFKGVTWEKRRRHYVARITVNGKTIYLGCFDNPVKAASWYRAFAELAHGEFAPAV